MIVVPKTRGFICTTAHPVGCGENVKQAAEYCKNHPNQNAPKRVLVVGSSTGYGLGARIAATFGSGADTVGVFFERQASGNRTATAGWYNNVAFENLARESGVKFKSINGDAFSKEIKAEAIEAIRSIMAGGKVDLIIYSLASPRRTDHDGNSYSSVIKPIGETYTSKTVDFHTGEVSSVTISPATPQEVADTVKVMGGEDWLLWIEALRAADVLGENFATVAFSYIGPSLTHPVYKDGTIGAAKVDLEEKAKEITALTAPVNGHAFVSVNKAVVTQASAAIPVVPLYISLLFKIMKEEGSHENTTQQGVRLLERLYPTTSIDWARVKTDDEGRIRLDDWEMKEHIQKKVLELWEIVNSENVWSLSDIEGYKKEFFALFGFGIDSVDYQQDVDINI